MDWSAGRHAALSAAVDAGADHVHYADSDRLLRWFEMAPGEFPAVLSALQQADCLMTFVEHMDGWYSTGGEHDPLSRRQCP